MQNKSYDPCGLPIWEHSVVGDLMEQEKGSCLNNINIILRKAALIQLSSIGGVWEHAERCYLKEVCKSRAVPSDLLSLLAKRLVTLVQSWVGDAVPQHYSPVSLLLWKSHPCLKTATSVTVVFSFSGNVSVLLASCCGHPDFHLES